MKAYTKSATLDPNFTFYFAEQTIKAQLLPDKLGQHRLIKPKQETNRSYNTKTTK